MLIQSHGRFDEVAEIDGASGNIIRVLSKKEQPQITDWCEEGVYSMIEGTYACLYRYENRLFLRVGSERVDVSDKEIWAIVTQKNACQTFRLYRARDKCRTFQLYRGQCPIISFQYKAPIIDPPLDLDPFSCFVEEEHFDFFLFVRNVLKNPQQKYAFQHGCAPEDYKEGPTER